MNPLRFLYTFAFRDSESMQQDRERIMGQVSAVTCVVMAPFLFYSLSQGRYLQSSAACILMAMLVVDLLALRRGARPPVPFPWLFLPILIATSVTVATLGVIGAFWGYPALIICHFVLNRRTAFFCSLLLIVAITALMAHYVSVDLALRVAATQVMTWVMINIVLNVLHEARRDMQLQATTDPLTGALNRRQLDLALGELVKRARRRPVPASIMLIDIDNFKLINDRLGHAVGDQVLTGLVKLLAERKRTSDSLYRLGGEEFLLLAPDTVGSAASALAEQLRAMIEKAELFKGLRVEVSIGVSECRTDQSPDEWLELADQALYRAKERGRNRVENSVFSDSAFKITGSPHAALSAGP
jgi:diguanylate cyclase (GGDEF)-like protein